MIFYFLISIVFISEVIICLAILFWLIKADKIILKYNTILDDTSDSIKSLMQTVRKISEQLVQLVPIFVDEIKSAISNLILGHIKNLAGTFVFLITKKEFEKLSIK